MYLVDFCCVCWAQGPPGEGGQGTGPDHRFPMFFASFFYGLLMVFAFILDDFFDDFQMFFASSFSTPFFIFFEFFESIFEPCDP